jgi:hypothetical protein
MTTASHASKSRPILSSRGRGELSPCHAASIAWFYALSAAKMRDLGTHLLIGTHHVTPVFRVELAGESRGVHEVTEHHGELPSFSLWSLRRLLCLGSRRLCCLNRKRGCGRCFRSVPRPHEDSGIFISCELLCLNDLCFECFKILVIQAEPYLEGWIRYSSLSFQEGDNLCEDVVECHVSASINASSCTIEQWQSIPRNHSKSGNASRESRSRIERACPGTRSMNPFCSNVTTMWCTAGAETLKYRCISVSAGG